VAFPIKTGPYLGSTENEMGNTLTKIWRVPTLIFQSSSPTRLLLPRNQSLSLFTVQVQVYKTNKGVNRQFMHKTT